MKKDAKKDTIFILIPGFAPDNVPVLNLQERLREEGYEALALAFWGTNEPVDFEFLTLEYCLRRIDRQIAAAHRRYRHVVGIGISLGGALLLEYAKDSDGLRCIVSIGTPFKLKKRLRISLGFIFYPIIRVIWKIREKNGAKRLLPIGAGKMVYVFLKKRFLAGLDRITTPVLLLQSRKDKITDYRAARGAIKKLGGRNRLIYLNGTNHVADYNAVLIIKLMSDFLDSAKGRRKS